MQSEKQEQIQTESNGISPATTIPSEPGTIHHATWLSDGLLLLAGRLFLETVPRLSATIVVRDRSLSAEAETIWYNMLNGQTSDGVPDAFIVVRCLQGKCPRETLQRLVLGSGPSEAVFGPPRLPTQLTDLRTLLRKTSTGMNADTRARIMAFLLSVAKSYLSNSSAAQLSSLLFAAREALRERLPSPIISKDHPFSGNVESIFAIDSCSFYIRGWIVSTDAKLTRVTAVSPEGCRIELLDRLFCYPRPDLTASYGAISEDGELRKGGFLGYFQVDVPSLLPEGWIVEVVNAYGEEIELQVPATTRNPVTIRNTLLGDIACDPDYAEGLLPDHLAPALQRIQDRNHARVRIARVKQYGTPPANPTVSLIIPLYGRIDFIEQQMAQFVHDPEISQADVLYVLDSPELAPAIQSAAPQLERLYRVPFRVAILQENVGFSEANNAGVSLARGRLLLLLNPDVLPDRPGWLQRMVTFYDTTPKIGALGPKLLYEDDSIQHAGLFFYREQHSGLWNNEHYYKGLHRAFPPANITRRVPAVSAACMMISADLYRDLGGLSGRYVLGDYEDSDFCLRLIAAGRENWYLADTELYHLEGQSYPSALRQITGRFNRWLHTHVAGSIAADATSRFHE